MIALFSFEKIEIVFKYYLDILYIKQQQKKIDGLSRRFKKIEIVFSSII